MKLTKAQIEILQKCSERPTRHVLENYRAVDALWVAGLVDVIRSYLYITDAGRKALEEGKG